MASPSKGQGDLLTAARDPKEFRETAGTEAPDLDPNPPLPHSSIQLDAITLEARAGLFEATAEGEKCRLVVPPRESFVRRGVPIRAEKHEVSTTAPSLRKPKIQPPSRTGALDAR